MPAARRSGLTTRAAVLALVVVALVVSAAIPLREYLAQRSEISVLLAERRAAEQRVADLEAARARLDDPAFITSEARRRLHFVLPGETAYVLLAPPAQADPAAEEAAQAPWWSQVWGSVEAADAPPPPAP